MGLTKWKRLADKKWDWSSEITYKGPACYELGVRRLRVRKITPVYTGKAKNLRSRLSQHANKRSNLGRYASKYWRMGYTIYVRYWKTSTEEKAKEKEEEQLSKWGLEKYPWNNNFPED